MEQVSDPWAPLQVISPLVVPGIAGCGSFIQAAFVSLLNLHWTYQVKPGVTVAARAGVVVISFSELKPD